MTSPASGRETLDTDDLKKTPLYDLHVELGAKMVPFAGYAMPVQYPSGILKEHLHTRARAGLFDVSHMGQVVIGGDDPAAAIEALVPGDIQALKPGAMRYSLFTSESGGILDDLMITRRQNDLFVVVNAACKEQDIAHMRARLPAVEVLEDRALLALQGPEAAAVLSALNPAVQSLLFMNGAEMELMGVACFVTRSGYTGEDGFEISVPAGAAADLARELLSHEAVAPIGLGARDSLRLEAGLCLYGHDIDETTTPVEAALTWVINKRRRAEGGFPGADVILEQIAKGVSRKRVGIRPLGKMPVREGAEVVGEDGAVIGKITSGGFGPSVGGPVAMGYVPAEMAVPGTALKLRQRGRLLEAEVAKLPFVKQNYHKG